MDTKFNSKSDVYDYMEDNMFTCKFRGTPHEFLPRSHLETVTGKSTIERVVKGDDLIMLNSRELSVFVEQVHLHGRRLFAICVYCDISMGALKVMVDNGLTDTRLPLGNDDFGSLDRHRGIVKVFTANQKHFNTAFFLENRIQELDDRISYRSIPIDFEECPANFKGRGAFGEVWKVKIHPDHRGFSCRTNENSQFAMKVTQHEGREQNYHRAMAGLNHPHLVKCLASFTMGTKYQMVYELANCDLELFIQRNPVASKVPGLTTPWLAQQLAGLAGALQVVHNPDGSEPHRMSNSLSVPLANVTKTGVS
ncbi:hypothetical protein P280DRAFT_522706 [Massarina eburnea CBS 473.64]|uniref:Protein kinase domain-containing protein n=1 Tax=Massarina eburnea CBS 473.64 TaxID=1395130 RepID=A0A6A6RKR9_9PLEO|nr:hypothetical protein P280DRAFT_522706 [Massarina eburnea CBS 473.64]